MAGVSGGFAIGLLLNNIKRAVSLSFYTGFSFYLAYMVIKPGHIFVIAGLIGAFIIGLSFCKTKTELFLLSIIGATIMLAVALPIDYYITNYYCNTVINESGGECDSDGVCIHTCIYPGFLITSSRYAVYGFAMGLILGYLKYKYKIHKK